MRTKLSEVISAIKFSGTPRLSVSDHQSVHERTHATALHHGICSLSYGHTFRNSLSVGYWMYPVTVEIVKRPRGEWRRWMIKGFFKHLPLQTLFLLFVDGGQGVRQTTMFTFNSIQFDLYSAKTIELSQGALQSPVPGRIHVFYTGIHVFFHHWNTFNLASGHSYQSNVQYRNILSVSVLLRFITWFYHNLQSIMTLPWLVHCKILW